jgi:biofilm PGA synthesis N-glycosyltransferase PgaC
LRSTLESVAAQTLLPALWVVVDDGSTDRTPEILEEYGARLPFLRVLRRCDRGCRSVGPGVVEAFYDGLATVNLNEFDFVCKLDMDLELPPRYFETLVVRMNENPRLGTCSGKPWFHHPATGKLVPEPCGDEMSVGMTKFYRVECFREIGGFVRQVMWDGIDCHRARMLGWIAQSLDDEELAFVHLRPMGFSQKGPLTGRYRHGFGQYFMGTSPLYIFASAIARLSLPPAVLGSAAMLWGYGSSSLRGLARYEDRDFRLFLRRYQRMSLLMGKRRAIERIDRERAAVWELRRSRHGAKPATASAAAALAVDRRGRPAPRPGVAVRGAPAGPGALLAVRGENPVAASYSVD